MTERVPTLDEQARRLRRTIGEIRECYTRACRDLRARRPHRPLPPLRIVLRLNAPLYARIIRSRASYLDGIRLRKDPRLLPGCIDGTILTIPAKRPRPPKTKRKRRQ